MVRRRSGRRDARLEKFSNLRKQSVVFLSFDLRAILTLEYTVNSSKILTRTRRMKNPKVARMAETLVTRKEMLPARKKRKLSSRVQKMRMLELTHRKRDQLKVRQLLLENLWLWMRRTLLLNTR